MALSSPITRTGIVTAVAQGSTSGTVAVQLALQSTSSTPAANVTVPLSTAEWNAIVAEQGASGANGIGVSLSISMS